MTLAIPVILAVAATLLYGVIRPGRKGALGLILLNLLILGIGALWWFFYGTADGLAQVLGVIIYAIAFVILSLIGTLVLRRRK